MARSKYATGSKRSGPKRKQAVACAERLRGIMIQETKSQTSISDISECESILGNESVATWKLVKEEFEHEQKEAPLACRYLNPIIYVHVGPRPVIYPVHREVLHQSSPLASRCDSFNGNFRLALPDVDPKVFGLVVDFLYRGTYELFPLGLGEGYESEFRNHALVYTLASKYDLGRLRDLAVRKMEILKKLDFTTLLTIAKEVYPNLPSDDVWFRNHLVIEASWASKENKTLAQKAWILDIFQNVGGMLAVDLFTALTKRQDSSPSKIPLSFLKI